MTGNGKYNNDDYVARLLAEDAKKSSQRYAATGLSALLPKRSTKAAPKPNTRFLNNLVREVDSHNAALKKKEELEARIRLRELRGQDSRDNDSRDEGRERKRRRTNEDSSEYARRDRSKDRRRSRSPRRNDDATDKRRSRTPRSHREHRRRRSRSMSLREDEQATDKSREKHRDRASHRPRGEYRNHRHRHRSKSSSAERKSHPHERSSHNEPRSRPRQSRPRSQSHSPTTRSRGTSFSSTSSDPLDSVLNPPPPIRGRGGQTNTHHNPTTSNIDRHFSTSYDPSHDIDASPPPSADPDRSDWDMALSALRDRASWKKTQAQRLRDAGFGEDEIRKWEKQAAPMTSARDGDVRDVKWVKKGEAREWDLGKKV